MWNELESYKHHYLQKELKHLKPLAISPMVRKEFNAAQSKRLTCIFTTAETHQCEESTYFDDHAQLAYGFFALPKLLCEICSDDLKTQWRAINSLSEFVMNPLNAQRAISEMDMVRILKNAFLRHRNRYFVEKYHEIEKLLETFRSSQRCVKMLVKINLSENLVFNMEFDRSYLRLILTGIFSIYLNGAREIAKKKLLVNEFYKIILKDEKHATLTSAILRNLTEKPDVLLYLHEQSDAFNNLSDIFHVDNCRPYYPYNLWMHLSHFIEIAPDKGVQLGFFELMHNRITGNAPQFYRMNMKCFALLLRCESGQKSFDEIDGVHMLYKLLYNEMEPFDTYEFIIMALLHGLQSKSAMWRAREFTNLPKILTKFALKKTHRNSRLQLYALKALRQLSEMPCIKEYTRENCLQNLSNLGCLNEENECERFKLVHWLERDIFESE